MLYAQIEFGRFLYFKKNGVLDAGKRHIDISSHRPLFQSVDDLIAIVVLESQP